MQYGLQQPDPFRWPGGRAGSPGEKKALDRKGPAQEEKRAQGEKGALGEKGCSQGKDALKGESRLLPCGRRSKKSSQIVARTTNLR